MHSSYARCIQDYHESGKLNIFHSSSSFFPHTLTLNRIQKKQAASTKTSKHFLELTKRKKIHLVKFNAGTLSLMHVCVCVHTHKHTDKKAKKYENQLEIHSLSFLGSLLSPAISFPNMKVFFCVCVIVGKNTIGSFTLPSLLRTVIWEI